MPLSSTCRPFELASAGAAIVSNPHLEIDSWLEPGEDTLYEGMIVRTFASLIACSNGYRKYSRTVLSE